MLNLPSILRKSKPGHDDDLKILRNWKEYTDDRKNMKYLMYELEMHEPGGNVVHFYKAIKLTRIIRLPKNAKQSESFMSMHSQVLAAVWERNIKLLTVIANLLNPVPLGMMYLYGVQGVAETAEKAKYIADNDFVAMASTLQGTYRVLEHRILTYDELEEFILLRIVFWQSGILLRNQMNSRLLLASREVENRNEVFIQWSLREDLSWKRYSEDEYKNLALGNGIGGWDGIPELYDFVMKNIENDQYKVMMIVKSLVVKIQNGLTYEEITSAYVNLLDEEDKEHQRILCELIRTLYKTVPLYSLKGHTRTEVEEESQEARFHVIQGGKE